MPRHLAALYAFIGGFAVMAIELAITRLLAPSFGTALPVWASTIGFVLLYLALGNALGGRLAARSLDEDSHRSLRQLRARAAQAMLAAGLLTLFLPQLARSLLDGVFLVYGQAIPAVMPAAFAAAALLLAPPILILGTILPLILTMSKTEGAHRQGEASQSSAARQAEDLGHLLGLSTFGGILGVFVTAFLLLPWIGTRASFISLGLVMVMAGLLGLSLRRWLPSLVLAVPLGLVAHWLAGIPFEASLAQRAEGERIVARQESEMHYIEVAEEPGGRRLLRLDEGAALQSVYLPGGGPLTGLVWDDLIALPLLLDSSATGKLPELERVLIVGLAGGTAARGLAETWAPERIDGVEIDPGVVEAGRAWFGLAEIPGLRIVLADGRAFVQRHMDVASDFVAHGEIDRLAAPEGNYDLIFLDAFRGPYPPFHLCTLEAMQDFRAVMKDGGLLVVNSPYTSGGDGLDTAIGRAMSEALQGPVWIVERPEAYNRLLVAQWLPAETAVGRELMTRRALRRLEPSAAALESKPGGGAIATAASRMRDRFRPFHFVATAARLTDDRAPVEWLVDGMIWRELRAGSMRP